MKKRAKRAYAKKELQIREKKYFLEKLELICERMVGPGYFQLLPPRVLEMAYKYRYPGLKIIRSTQDISDEETLEYRKALVEILAALEVETHLGEKISYKWYLRDILVFIHAIEFGVRGGVVSSSRLVNAFKPYFRNTEWYIENAAKTTAMVSLINHCMFDFNKGFVVSRLDQMAFHNAQGLNHIRLFRYRPPTISLRVNGFNRPLIKLGNYDLEKGLHWVNVSPPSIGFSNPNLKPVYVQQHMFHRFEERAGLPAGFGQHFLLEALADEKATYHVRRERILLECRAWGSRIGYFVISAYEHGFVVHTFLFLTNDSTPEGRRLVKLTQLERSDTRHLGIDRIDSFLKYDIAGDRKLKDIFLKAGCGSLLEYSEKVQTHVSEPLKNAAFIHQYIRARG